MKNWLMAFIATLMVVGGTLMLHGCGSSTSNTVTFKGATQ